MKESPSHVPGRTQDDLVCNDVPEIPFRDALKVWVKVAINSFGGPTGQIAVMNRYVVEENRWISETRFLHALNYCMLLPGPEAQQLATYIGWLLHRTWGGLVAGTLFILPGFLSILALSIVYTEYRDTAIVEHLFWGLKPAVLAVVLLAVIRIGRKALRNQIMIAVAAAAFFSIFLFNLPFPAIVASAGLIGYLGSRFSPDLFVLSSGHDPATASPESRPVIPDDCVLEHTKPTKWRNVRLVVIFSILWIGPIIFLAGTLGWDNVFVQESLFFSKAAVVTFGGAYAVLSYMAQQAVETYGWLYPGEMLDGLGLAETTPGPLIQVVQFVGFLGAYRNPGSLDPLVAGVAASVLVTWVTFVPCFLWIFLGAPYIEALRGNKSLTGALSAITASVVGVILNLAVWFALHTIFGSVKEVEVSVLKLSVPVWETVSFPSIVLFGIAILSLSVLKVGVIPTIALSALLGAGYHLIIK